MQFIRQRPQYYSRDQEGKYFLFISTLTFCSICLLLNKIDIPFPILYTIF